MDDILDIPDDWKIAGHDKVVGVPTKDQGFIITGLGGEGKQIRYFVVIPATSRASFRQSFKNELVGQFKTLFPREKIQLEKIAVRRNHIRLWLLIHMDYSIEEVVMAIIFRVNKQKRKLLEHYFVVNTQIPDENEIDNYLEETKKIEITYAQS